jgi:hypothetical protein
MWKSAADAPGHSLETLCMAFTYSRWASGDVIIAA